MTRNSLRAPDPPGQDSPTSPEAIGQWREERLTLHATDDPSRAVVLRHRVVNTELPNQIAVVDHDGGVVRGVAWDEWHLENTTPSWRAGVEKWVRAKIAADWAVRA